APPPRPGPAPARPTWPASAAPAGSAAATTPPPPTATTPLPADAGRPWSASVGREPVAGPAHGLQRATAERRVDLAPNVPGVDLDHVQVRHRVRVPDVLEQLGL